MNAGDIFVGNTQQRIYTPEEQSVFNQQFPGLVWRNGRPYQRNTDAPVEWDGYGVDPNQSQGSLVPAELETTPLWKQLLQFVGTTSAVNAGATAAGAGNTAFTGGASGTAAGGQAATSPYEIGYTGTAGTTAGAGSVPAAGGVGMGTTAATTIPGGAAAASPAAAPVLSGAGTTAATGWRAWLPKVQQFLPVVGDVVRGVTANSALNNAQASQQAATDAAMARNDQANQRIGDVYQQQRQDTQNLANVPYQTLGSLMGMNIANIGPATGNIPTTVNPTGRPRGLMPADQVAPMSVQPGNYDFAPGFTGQTLAQLVDWQKNAKAKTSSSYKRA